MREGFQQPDIVADFSDVSLSKLFFLPCAATTATVTIIQQSTATILLLAEIQELCKCVPVVFVSCGLVCRSQHGLVLPAGGEAGEGTQVDEKNEAFCASLSLSPPAVDSRGHPLRLHSSERRYWQGEGLLTPQFALATNAE